ncbi:MAG: DUF2877 domain-containing protein [Chloroflexi bacterium]|jgi:hypothetical protein|nr:DUF2877 domain-containing protein [Chloroflexota bacterium]
MLISTLLTPRVQQWLDHGRPARLLHLFDVVCNLVNDQGSVISLATPAIGAGPFTMVLSDDFPNQLSYIGLNDPVTIDTAAHTLTIGSLSIDNKHARLWDPKPQWSNLRHAQKFSWPAARPLPPKIESHLQGLLAGIIDGDSTTARAATRALAGLGDGLTPTGDDVLIGVLYALWVYDPQQEWKDLIANSAVARTTTLSAAFLRAAAAGEATIHWHHLVHGRADAISQIQAIGHSSGADAWAGFITAYKAFFESRYLETV